MELTKRRRERELAGDQRAGAWAREKARRAQHDFVRRNWKLYAGCAIGVLALVAFNYWLLRAAPFLQGAVAGGLVVGATACLWNITVQSTGTGATMMGDLAEQWTAQELRKLRRSGWLVINQVKIGPGDIDHVLVGPGGVYIVETKWSSPECDVAYLLKRRRQALDQLRRNGRSLALWHELRSRHIPVHALLALWGGLASASPDDEAVQMDGEIVVAHGQRGMNAWRRGLASEQRLPQTDIDAVWHALDQQSHRSDTLEEGQRPRSRSAFAIAFGILEGTVAATASFALLTFLLTWSSSAWIAIATAAVVVAIAELARRASLARAAATGVIVGAGGLTVALLLAYFAYWIGAYGPAR